MKRIFITAPVLLAPLNAAYAGCYYACRNLTNEKALLIFVLLLLFFAGMGLWGCVEDFKNKNSHSLLLSALMVIINLSGLFASFYFGGAVGFLGALFGNTLLFFLTPK